jgi:hypothetical protein
MFFTFALEYPKIGPPVFSEKLYLEEGGGNKTPSYIQVNRAIQVTSIKPENQSPMYPCCSNIRII